MSTLRRALAFFLLLVGLVLVLAATPNIWWVLALVLGVAFLVAVMMACRPREERWIVVHRDTEELVKACFTEREAELLRGECGDRYIVRKVLR